MSTQNAIRMLLLLIGVSFILLTQPSKAQNVKTYIHPKAETLMPLVVWETRRYLPDLSTPWYMAGLAEHESCISFKHRFCWDPSAELKNNREHGLGLFMLTRSWTEMGVLRFDNLAHYRSRYPAELGQLDWQTFKNRYDLQVRTAVIMVRELLNQFRDVPNERERLKFANSAYNGGAAHVRRARETCRLTKGCDPNVWDQNVVIHLPKSRVPDPRYGNRSFYQINVHHVHDVFYNRMPKFEPFFAPGYYD